MSEPRQHIVTPMDRLRKLYRDAAQAIIECSHASPRVRARARDRLEVIAPKLADCLTDVIEGPEPAPDLPPLPDLPTPEPEESGA